MINANELRIGNLVITDDGKIVKVKNINNDGINGEWDSEWATFYHKWLKGIPLTPEMLEKAGFIHETDWKDGYELPKGKYRQGNIYISFGDTEFGLSKGAYLWAELGSPDDYGYHVTHFGHVHQLQNLYFALTGEELQIKEPVS